MRVITAPDKYILEKDEVSVFLAGGITDCPPWQNDIIQMLATKRQMEKLVVFNPRRDNFPINDPSAAEEQIEWEFEAQEAADIFSVYFSSGDSVQPISLYELGRNIVKKQIMFPIDWEHRIIISVERGYKRTLDVLTQTRLACGAGFFRINVLRPENLKEYHVMLIADAYNKIQRSRGSQNERLQRKDG